MHHAEIKSAEIKGVMPDISAFLVDGGLFYETNYSEINSSVFAFCNDIIFSFVVRMAR
jgi:hypothetical protein